MRTRSAALLLPLLLSAAPSGAGTVSGSVSLLDENGQPRRDASNVVVWIEGVPRGGAAGSKSAQMKQASKRFQPRVLAVTKDATVDFPNDDPIYHNVFSVSGDNRFDLGLYRSGASKSKKFEQTGLVRVYCNIHPQMIGFVLVVDTDDVAVTGPDGKFRFDNVPPGTYTLKAWSEEGGESAKSVTVHASGDSTLSLSLDVSGFKAAPHKNKYGKDYAPNAGSETDERY